MNLLTPFKSNERKITFIFIENSAFKSVDNSRKSYRNNI